MLLWEPMEGRSPFLAAASLFVLLWTAAALPSLARESSEFRGQLSGTFVNRLAHPAIEYASRPTHDPVSDVIRRMEDGRVTLKSEGPSGYLRSLLQTLNVPIESQIVVFTPDSVQRHRIDIRNPRTIFFNDSVAVGWVRGGFIELASQDPVQGVIFYALDRVLTSQAVPRRRDDCLMCHHSYSNVGVPGMLARSILQFSVDHRLPFEQRWGGWYVTGRTGSIRHMGNTDPDQLFASSRPADTFNWPSLTDRLDVEASLSPHSDVAALMVFEHQMHMMNLLTRIGWEARVAAYDETSVDLEDGAIEVVDYMLFVEEAPLPDAVQRSSGFPATFAAQGPRDGKGRSLRDLDLKRRLLKYPCNYLIYSEQFAQLPPNARAAIYQRLWQVLSGQDKDPKCARLSTTDRAAIVEILRGTIRDLPAYFFSPRLPRSA